MASFDSFLPSHLGNTPTPAAPGNTPTPAAPQTSQMISVPLPRRPLRREGAMIILSAAEQAMEDAMLRSSPTPEPVLGKRTHNSPDGDDTEPDDEPTTTQSDSSLPLSSNVAAATVRYAAKKKLRPEQRDEVDAFLLVSPSLMRGSACAYGLLPGYSSWPTGQIVCGHIVS